MEKIALALVMVPALSFAQAYPPPPAKITTTSYSSQNAKAVVVRVAPIYEQIVVGKNCQATQQTSSPTGMIVGGATGAALGNQMGNGTGKVLTTIIGAVAGGYVGNEVAVRSAPQVVCTPITQLRQTANQYIAEYNGISYSGVSYRELKVGDTVYVDAVTLINAGE